MISTSQNDRHVRRRLGALAGIGLVAIGAVLLGRFQLQRSQHSSGLATASDSWSPCSEVLLHVDTIPLPDVDREAASPSRRNLRSWIEALSAPERLGRSATGGSAASVAELLSRELVASGLRAARSAGACQSFELQGQRATNLVVRIPHARSTAPPMSLLLVAHYDGQGVHPSLGVLPGADDNASGVAALLEVARILAHHPLQHLELLLALTSGEEAGQVGSRHLARALAESRPPVALVLDMVGRPLHGEGHGFELVERPVRASPRSQDLTLLVDVLQSVAQGKDLVLLPGPVGPEREGARGDEDSLAEGGIPAILMTSGLHADYHGPGDTADRVDLAQVRRAAALVLETLRTLDRRLQPP